MAFAPWTGPHFKHTETPAVVTKAKRRTDKAEALKDAYADVDARDKGICKVTGRHTSPGAPDPRVRREHHHIVKRSRDKGLIAVPANVITVCAEAHGLIEAGWIVVEGTNADKPNGVRFHWREGVDPKLKILVIKSRRKTAREPE